MTTEKITISQLEKLQAEIQLIKQLQQNQLGYVECNGKQISALLEFEVSGHLLKIGDIIDLDLDSHEFLLVTDSTKMALKTWLTAHGNSLHVNEQKVERYTEGKIDSLIIESWTDVSSNFRSYYKTEESRLLYELFGSPSKMKFELNQTEITLRYADGYLVIENDTKLDFEEYSEICYAVLVSIGFLSGKFIQDQVYIFQVTSDHTVPVYRYERLRRGTSSIYHAVTANAFSYEHLIGIEKAANIYQSKMLKHIDAKCISSLTKLVLEHHQILYAIVLFNEANDNCSSLLIKNNCFFAVLEVLRKYFHSTFENTLPANYSQRGNVEKFRLVFENIAPVTAEEVSTISKRNTFMHGDIKDFEGREMVSLMQKQITLIYKIMLSYVGFYGYIIDHFAIRNQPEMAFVKLH